MDLKIKFEENYIAQNDMIKRRLVAYYPNGFAVYVEFEKEIIDVATFIGMLEIFKNTIIKNAHT